MNSDLIIKIYSYILGRIVKNINTSSINKLINDLFLEEKKIAIINQLQNDDEIKENYLNGPHKRYLTYDFDVDKKYSSKPFLTNKCKHLSNLVNDIALNNFNISAVTEINNEIINISDIDNYFNKKYGNTIQNTISLIFDTDDFIWENNEKYVRQLKMLIFMKNICSPYIKYINEFLIHFNIYWYREPPFQSIDLPQPPLHRDLLSQSLSRINNLNQLFKIQLYAIKRNLEYESMVISIEELPGISPMTWKTLLIFSELNNIQSTKEFITNVIFDGYISEPVVYFSHNSILRHYNKVI